METDIEDFAAVNGENDRDTVALWAPGVVWGIDFAGAAEAAPIIAQLNEILDFLGLFVVTAARALGEIGGREVIIAFSAETPGTPARNDCAGAEKAVDNGVADVELGLLMVRNRIFE